MYLAVVIFPIKIYTQVPFAPPIVGDFVVISEDFHEVLYVVFANIFHTKIINAERKAYRAPVVRQKSRDNLTLVIAPLVQLFLE